MEGLPIGLAAAAGLVAVVNPCGFALLPAYASLLVGDDEPRKAAAIRRALGFAAAMTLGFVVVFGLFGLVLTAVTTLTSVQRYLPWFTVVLGIALLGLGAWVLSGRRIPGLPIAVRAPEVRRTASSMAMFGAAYAAASLTCTIAPFIATVVASFRARSALDGLVVFGAYAGGMALVVTVVSLAVAVAQTSVVTWMRRSSRFVPRLGGVLLLIAGAYVAYYGWYQIRVLRAGAADDPIIAAGESVQRWLADGVANLGLGGMLAAAAALLVIGITIVVIRRGRARTDEVT